MCKKIKLPRKRKKAFLKTFTKSDYLCVQLLGEVLCEEGVKHADRFYQYRAVKTKEERKRPDYKNGYVIEKRW